MPEKSNVWSSASVPVDLAAKLTFSADAAANSNVADPLIVADPVPLTLPSTVQGKPTLPRIDVRGDYLVSVLVSVLRNRILLIFGRVALVFRRHSQILCSADRTIGGPCRVVEHRNRPPNADLCTYLERSPELHLCCSGLGFRDLLEFEEYFLAVLSEIPDHFAVAQELRQIASSEHQVQMVYAIGLLGHLELARK